MAIFQYMGSIQCEPVKIRGHWEREKNWYDANAIIALFLTTPITFLPLLHLFSLSIRWPDIYNSITVLWNVVEFLSSSNVTVFESFSIYLHSPTNLNIFNCCRTLITKKRRHFFLQNESTFNANVIHRNFICTETDLQLMLRTSWPELEI